MRFDLSDEEWGLSERPLPRRREVWQAAMLGMLGGAVAAVTLIEALARSCL